MKITTRYLVKTSVFFYLSFYFCINLFASANTDYFRSKVTTGYWNLATNWESSPDNGITAWVTSNKIPGNSSQGITIKNGHTITIDAAAASSYLTVETGGILIHTNGITLNISNGLNTYDFIVNGTYVLNGTQAVLSGSTAGQVNGLVRVDNNTAGESDDFARNSRITFSSGSVFQWNITQLFETGTSGVMTYMPNSGTGAIFRVTADLNSVGNTGTNSILFNSKFEVASGYTVKFVRNGTKYFRDGLGGGGTIVHQSLNGGAIANCGLFQITGTSAVIDGTITIDIEHTTPTTDFEISGNTTISGTPTLNIGKTISTDATLVISGNLLDNSTNPINLDKGNLNISGAVGGTGTFSANSINTSVTISRTSSNSAGTLNFTTGFNTIKDFTMNASGTMGRVILGTALNIANSITLTKGAIVTADNLLTWNNAGGTITYPTGSSYANSFIATCAADGSALTLSVPYDGSKGFRINNVGGSVDKTFPVAATYLNSGSVAATPNKMMINNAGTTDYFTVVVMKELMLYTPLSGVNRVWYVIEGTSGGSNATMALYFTKRDWTGYPTTQDEIETGFLYSDPHLVQQTYAYEFVSNSALPAPTTGDVPSYIASSNGTEIFAQYRRAISPDLSGVKNGIKEFSRFSVFNANNIVLPVSVTNVKAYQKGNTIQVAWSALNEINIEHYEIERSTNAVSFNKIAATPARNNNAPVNDYIATDAFPAQGKIFYRIKIIDKTGKVTYTSIVSIDISNGKISISVIPNPVHNKIINLQLNNLTAGKYNLFLYSTDGKIVYNKTIEHAGGTSVQQLVLPSGIAPGTYLIRLYHETQNFTVGMIVE